MTGKSLFPKTFLFCLALVLALFMAGPLPAQEKTKVSQPWTVDDVINQERASDFQISPDGTRVVWVKNVPDREKDGRISHLFIYYLDREQPAIQLTRGASSESRPRWSPDGQRIAFLSSRTEPSAGATKEDEGKGQQLWLLDLRGGEPWKVTSLEFGVIGYDWLDNDHFLILAREPKTLREIKEKEKKDDSIVYEDQEHMIPQRLFMYCLKEKTWHRLTENNDQITSFALSPDKKLVVTRNNQSLSYEVDKRVKPKYFLVNLQDRSSREIFPDPHFKPTGIYWDPNNQGFYFTVMKTVDPVNETTGAEFLYYYDLKSATHREIDLDWDWGLMGMGLEVRDDGFIAFLASGAVPRWRRYYRQGENFTHKELEGSHYPHLFNLTLQEKGNRLVYAHTTASRPPQWFAGLLEDNRIVNQKQLTELNGHLQSKKMARTEVIKWKGALDDEIEGILYYPHDYQPGRRYPLFLNIHGGPMGIDMDAFEESYAYYPNILAQKGCFVLMPNYHGSMGYGQKFAESIRGHYYEYELEDMLKGIDHLVARGLVDPDRLGTMGWSNGGILSIGLAVWTDRFKVAGIGAADVNWISDYGTCAFGVSFDNYYLLGPPWERPDYYIKKSPLFHFKDMKVPTIIFHGTEDTSVPFGQGMEHYRALKEIGQAPVRFIIFPGEPHGLRKLSHQRRKMEEELAWFDKHFFKTFRPENEALKEGSPLDLALKAQKFSRSGRSFGLLVKGKLIPETVKWQDLEVGRFEVTRAQWKAYDPGYQFEPGTENYPVSGITFDQARNYVRWLSQLTGENYRLPGEQEARSLLTKASAEDNTLDYWAGYPVNFDDARLLGQVISSLKGKAPLLLPVDRFSPATDSLIFGLGGSVAEWTVDASGKGKALGLSAVHRSKATEAYAPPPAEYIGLRVFKQAKK
ncbi:MAG: prolyl oligopeptidase family serine peptidase [Candidatus Saccharicenans sp.]|jgi:dipeptidyl aminopeptidase/acylaminoacyl peptidase|nr:prolyl oligopeptidase family serine peptidase [Candidatus Saccharicenans sp.]MDH7576146.1 prolyl oligopeptidase family serine peptidase [Candidatus Saccharicenans sp.]